MGMLVRVHIKICGRVQGVCFRHYCREMAEQLGLTGWVRNNEAGRVEVVSEGEEEKVLRLVEWCRRGPPYAHVVHCETTYDKATGEYDSFEIQF